LKFRRLDNTSYTPNAKILARHPRDFNNLIGLLRLR